MHNRVFFTTTVRELKFEGLLSVDGPYISCNARHGGVAFGVCSLRKFCPDRHLNRPGHLGWWLVKYEDQPRLDLTDFTDAEAKQLGDAFGMVLLPDPPRIVTHVRPDSFFSSQAWEALRVWCEAHPRLAKEYSSAQAYLPGWYERAIRLAR